MTPLEKAAYDIGAKGSEPTENERLAFEAWMRGHCWKVEGDWDGKQYVHAKETVGYVHGGAMNTRRLWAAWRDRGALAMVLEGQAQETRTALEQYDLDQSADYQKGWNDGRIKGYEVGHRYATEAGKAQAVEPVAWLVYVAEANNQYAVCDIDDQQLVDDCTNHNAEVTPLFTHPDQPATPLFAGLIATHDGLADELKAQQVAVPQGEVANIWCETCEGTSKVYEEAQIGIPGSGGTLDCPDCGGKGYITSSVYRTNPLTPQAMAQQVAAPDMFWNHDDADKLYSSISEFLNDEMCQGTPIDVGDIRTVQRAVRLPNIDIRITFIDEEDCNVEYEIVKAAQGAKPA